MNIFLKIAWRNILRNKRRSAITISAVSFGLAAVIFLWSFVDGFQNQMEESIKNIITGDIQIYPQGAEGLYNVNLLLENPEEVRKVLEETSSIRKKVERVLASGIVSSANNSLMTFVGGIAPDQEKKFNPKSMIVKGRELDEKDEHSAVLGLPMAKQLQVDLGDKVVLVLQDRFGSLVGESFRVVGFFETGSDQIDNSTVYVIVTVLQKLLSAENQVTKILLRTQEGVAIEQVIQELKSKLDPKRYKISPWGEIAPMLSQLIEFQQRMIFIVVLIVLSILGTGVLNTLMMSYIERIREFGLMKALGTKDSQVSLLLILETLWLTFVGTLLGAGLGLGLSFFFANHGINLSRFGETFSNFLIGTTIYPKIHFNHVGSAVLVVLCANLIAALYPAWKASKLEPMEAMRQVG